MQDWIDRITALIQEPTTTSLYISIGVVVFLLLTLLVVLVNRRARKERAYRYAPRLVLDSVQVSPLGRDVYVKITNAGPPAVFTKLDIKGRRDLIVKNQIAGHRIERNTPYRILLEATGTEKVTPNFTMVLTFLDAQGNVFTQEFDLARTLAQKPRLLKTAKQGRNG